ncbi:response regulator [Anaeromyxobacter terrae]|uniref:response regulator n=1 Tax=Anaeromyxobacter terrae TaxID=2925406 RepID=UPI001F56E99E|nr:response regulator [Anaeromyxobacter sp. SG22]
MPRFPDGIRVPTVQPNVASPARILVVEDDTAIRQTLAELLQDEGFEVSCAANGAEALAHLTRSVAPSVILLDLTMPVMDGWTFRSAQREDPRLAGIPTVVVSANHATDRRAVAGLEAAAFLAKPFDLDSLIDTIHRLC